MGRLKDRQWMAPVWVRLMAVLLVVGVVFGASSEPVSAETESYAGILFEEVEKNAQVPYLGVNPDLENGSVRGIVDGADEGKGQEYAMFLKTMHDWNLWVTHGNEIEKSMSGLRSIGKQFLAWTAYIGESGLRVIDVGANFLAEVLDSVNIFKDFGDGDLSGKWYSFLQPLADVVGMLSGVSKAVVMVLMAWVITMTIIGVGRARARGGYFARGAGRIFLIIFAMVGLPLMVSALITMFTGFIKESDSLFAHEEGQKISDGYVVSAEYWADNSILEILNGEDTPYTLSRGESRWPKRESRVVNGHPSLDFISGLPIQPPELSEDEQMDGLGSKFATYGRESLILTWGRSETVTATGLSGRYNVLDNADELSDYQDRDGIFYQFKLALKSSGVHVITDAGGGPFGGMLPSLDLTEPSIQKVSFAGNGFVDMTLKYIFMVVNIWCVFLLSVVLIIGVITSIYRGLILMVTNISMAMLGSVAGLVGVITALMMTVVVIITAVMSISIYSEVVKAAPEAFASIFQTVDDKNDTNLLASYFGNLSATIVTIIGLVLVLKSRKAVLSTVEDFFKSILLRLNLGSANTSRGEAALQGVGAEAREGVLAPERATNVVGSMSKAAGAAAVGAGLSGAAMMTRGVREDMKSGAEAAEGAKGLGKVAAGVKGMRDSAKQRKESDKRSRGQKFKDGFKDVMKANPVGQAAGQVAQAGVNAAHAEMTSLAEDGHTAGAKKLGAVGAKGIDGANNAVHRMFGRKTPKAIHDDLKQAEAGATTGAQALSDMVNAEQEINSIQKRRNAAIQDGANPDSPEMKALDKEMATAQQAYRIARDSVVESSEALLDSKEAQDDINNTASKAHDAVEEAKERESRENRRSEELGETVERLQAERADMVASGANDAALAEKDAQIEQAEATRLESQAAARQAGREVRDNMELVEAGVLDYDYGAGVMMDHNAAEEGLMHAEATYNHAKQHGVVPEENAGVLSKQAAGNVEALEADVAEQEARLQGMRTESDAYNHLSENGGRAFTDEDVTHARHAADTAEDALQRERQTLSEMKAQESAHQVQEARVADAQAAVDTAEEALAQAGTPEARQEAEQQLARANADLSAANDQLQTLSTTRPSTAQISEQMEAVEAAEAQAETANQAVEQSTSAMNDAEQRVTEARQAAGTAEDALERERQTLGEMKANASAYQEQAARVEEAQMAVDTAEQTLAQAGTPEARQEAEQQLTRANADLSAANDRLQTLSTTRPSASEISKQTETVETAEAAALAANQAVEQSTAQANVAEQHVTEARQAADTAANQLQSKRQTLDEMRAQESAYQEQAARVADAKTVVGTAKQAVAQAGTPEARQEAEQQLARAKADLSTANNRLQTLSAARPSASEISEQTKAVEAAEAAHTEAVRTEQVVSSIADGTASTVSEAERKQEVEYQQVLGELDTAFKDLSDAQVGVQTIQSRIKAGEKVRPEEITEAQTLLRAANQNVEAKTQAHAEAVEDRSAHAEAANRVVEQSTAQVNAAEQRVAALKEQKAPASEIQTAESAVTQAKERLAGHQYDANVAQQAVNSTQAGITQTMRSTQQALSKKTALQQRQMAGEHVSATELAEADEEVKQAQTRHSNAVRAHKSTMNARMQGARVSDTMVHQQKRVVDEASKRHSVASQQVEDLERRQAAGENIAPERIASAQAASKRERLQMERNKRLYSGMNAQQVTGGRMDTKKQNAANTRLKEAQAGLTGSRRQLKDMKAVAAGRPMGRGDLVRMGRANDTLVARTKEEIKSHESVMRTTRERLDKKIEMKANGMPVSSTDIRKEQSRLDTATQARDTAQGKLTQLKQESRDINTASTALDEHFKQAAADKTKAESRVRETKASVEEMKARRGVNPTYLEKFKSRVQGSIETLESSPASYTAERERQLSKIRERRVGSLDRQEGLGGEIKEDKKGQQVRRSDKRDMERFIRQHGKIKRRK